MEHVAPQSRRTRFVNLLFEPVDVASIAVFRIAFGAILVWETTRYFQHGWIARYWIQPVFHFTYYGFGWVHPWPGDGMYVHFVVMGLAALCVALGFWYRASAIVLWLAFTYQFLLDEARYLNHFYAASLFAFLLAVIPAHRAFSLDAWRRKPRRAETVSRWNVWLLRAQVGVIYFFGGVAKINPDWLHGEPMRSWLLSKAGNPIIGLIVKNSLELWVFSYGGLAFDLLVVPALLWRRTRPYAFVAAIAFHVINSQLFSIGIFPWMMIAATTIFFDPSWPRRLCARVRRTAVVEEQVNPVPVPGAGRLVRAAVPAFLAAYVGLQIFIPIRHVFYPGNVSWTEEGHRFSWQMKLRDKEGTASFVMKDKHTGNVVAVNPDTVIEPWQAARMATRPDMILQFAHYLARGAHEKGEDVSVYAFVPVALNAHDARLLVDPKADLAAERRTLWPARWVTRGSDVDEFYSLPDRNPDVQDR